MFSCLQHAGRCVSDLILCKRNFQSNLLAWGVFDGVAPVRCITMMIMIMNNDNDTDDDADNDNDNDNDYKTNKRIVIIFVFC